MKARSNADDDARPAQSPAYFQRTKYGEYEEPKGLERKVAKGSRLGIGTLLRRGVRDNIKGKIAQCGLHPLFFTFSI